MTSAAMLSLGASSTSANWDAIDWQPIEANVRRLQMRIAKATREGRWGKVKALQWLLTHSFSAKLLAVRRVVRLAMDVVTGSDFGPLNVWVANSYSCSNRSLKKSVAV